MVMQVKPITPQEAQEKFVKRVPDIIIETINDLIVKHYNPNNGEAIVKQDEILDNVCSEETFTRNQVFKNHWLDVEDLYRSQGWTVYYDKPAYCENYDAYFKFVGKLKKEKK